MSALPLELPLALPDRVSCAYSRPRFVADTPTTVYVMEVLA
jgi:hypothetical protein